MNQFEDVALHDEAHILLGLPGNDLEQLSHKLDHYTDRLTALKESKAPPIVIKPFERLQRKFQLALSMKRNAIEMRQHAGLLA